MTPTRDRGIRRVRAQQHQQLTGGGRGLQHGNVWDPLAHQHLRCTDVEAFVTCIAPVRRQSPQVPTEADRIAVMCVTQPEPSLEYYWISALGHGPRRQNPDQPELHDSGERQIAPGNMRLSISTGFGDPGCTSLRQRTQFLTAGYWHLQFQFSSSTSFPVPIELGIS